MAAAAIIKFADLLSAFLGLAGAIVLGLPALTAVRFKRYWEQTRVVRADPEASPETKKALEGVQDHVASAQLGDSEGARRINAWGFSLLAGSFFFLLIAAIARACGTP